ncbi:lysyl oxidase homolog 4-like isoform X2 [Liolophura sinensis]|uniref:lysyl oxidase homolog 4-like isoform X2 n=1 Tax=Liolophura sinensis TaxID=3198878 RepID=UPI0031589C52
MMARKQWSGEVSVSLPTFIVTLVLLSVNGYHAEAIEDGSIRLVGGRSDFEGTVLIYHMGLWGAICDKGWSRKDAHVVCKQLGYPGKHLAFKKSFFGKGSAWMWMSRVRCYGNEKRLDKCRFPGWGRSNCYGGRSSAGVRCMTPSTTPPPTTSTTTTTPPPKTLNPNSLLADEPAVNMTEQFEVGNDDSDNQAENVVEDEGSLNISAMDTYLANSTESEGRTIRLNGGRFKQEGRVEVKVPGRLGWSAVCGDTWGILEGMVTCKQLGYGYAKVTTSTSFYGGERMHKIYKHVKCTGKEERLDDCDIHVKENGVACNYTTSIAGVFCTKKLPDLVPNVTVLETSAHLRDHHLYYLQCAMEENCLASSAYALRKSSRDWVQSVRRVMRFSSVIHNRGTDDFRPIIPKERWDWHECHMHYHSMEVFAHYDITDLLGNKVAEGHKASFCLEDSQCDPGKDKKFQCKGFADQGISVNCSDNYLAEIDCQWIDITDLSPGTYTFRVLVNPELRVAELNFDNNLVSCDMFYSLYKFKVENCTIGPEPLSRI